MITVAVVTVGILQEIMMTHLVTQFHQKYQNRNHLKSLPKFHLSGRSE
jgi:hypothetical protein